MERFCLHVGSLQGLFSTSPKPYKNNASRSTKRSGQYLQRAIIDKCEISQARSEAGGEPAQPMLYFRKSDDLAHDVTNGWNKLVEPAVHILTVSREPSYC